MDPITTLQMLAALVIIVIAAEIFTNALEHLGERMGISEGVTGSLFAAVGTAMPESMIPILAIFAGTASQAVNEEIGVGAILGAPLLLSTLALGILSISVLKRRGFSGVYTPEPSGLERDLNFFLMAFGLAAIALFVPHSWVIVRFFLGAGLILLYFVYVLLTIRASSKLVADGHGTESHRGLLVHRIGIPDNISGIVLQLVLGLGLLIGGAKMFIHSVEQTAAFLGVSALLLSLLIVPIATELPEKVNSILWARRGKDTLAFGNVTGAMVFQGSLLPAIGIFLTPWEPRKEVVIVVLVTLAGALWLRSRGRARSIKVSHLFINGFLYILYVGLVLF